MSWLGVLPSIDSAMTRRCCDGIAPELRGSIVVVDNTVRNRGVARSWNIGIERMLATDARWLVIISAAMRFGQSRMRDFIARIIHAADDEIAVEGGHGIGWHLIAFRRDVFECVGRFDENFYPAYWEDLDFSWRVKLGFGLDPPYWSKFEAVDAICAEIGHGISRGGVTVDPDALIAYYLSKWGAFAADESWRHPFNDPTRPLSWWPTPKELPHARC